MRAVTSGTERWTEENMGSSQRRSAPLTACGLSINLSLAASKPRKKKKKKSFSYYCSPGTDADDQENHNAGFTWLDLEVFEMARKPQESKEREKENCAQASFCILLFWPITNLNKYLKKKSVSLLTDSIMFLLHLFVLKVTFCCGISCITGAGLFSLNVESLLLFFFSFSLWKYETYVTVICVCMKVSWVRGGGWGGASLKLFSCKACKTPPSSREPSPEDAHSKIPVSKWARRKPSEPPSGGIYLFVYLFIWRE